MRLSSPVTGGGGVGGAQHSLSRCLCLDEPRDQKQDYLKMFIRIKSRLKTFSM